MTQFCRFSYDIGYDMGYNPVNTLMVLFEVYATLENVNKCGIGRVRTAYPIKEPRLICKYLN